MASSDFRRGIRVYLETSDYTKGINQLVQENKKLNKEYAELKSRSGELNKTDQKRLKQLEKQLKRNAETEVRYKKTLKETEATLKNLSGKTYNELVAARNQVRKELRNAVRGTKEYDARLQMHKRLTKEVSIAEKEMSVAVGCQANVFGRVTGFVNKYWAVLGGGIAAITGISMRFRSMAEEVAKMDDVYSDVMKTTNLTHKEVEALNEQFKKMDTRTSRESLNNLARDAGKLGIEGTKNILDFVDAGNQINVALGEDLGEDAIKSIGKMVGVFDKSTKHLRELDLKGQMLAVGSAINELGASSSANEQYLVDFAGRLGGVASQAGISIDAILGFGSALDQDMQKVEMAATALQNFIMKLMGEPAKFAKIAEEDVKKFSDLLKTDANAAIKLVLRSLNEKGGFQQLIPIFNEMGLDGARAVGVLSSMASGIKKIDKAQRVANEALTEGSSVTKEYGIKNENLQAKLEKARKEMKERSMELGQRLNPLLLKSTNLLTYILKILPDVFRFLDKTGPTLIKITALILAYNIGLKAQMVWKRIAIVDTIKLRYWYLQEAAAVQFVALKNALAAKSKKQLYVATKRLWATLRANPWGLVVSGVVALLYVIYKLSKSNAKLLTQSAAMVEINKKVAESTGHERAELDMLLGVARNEKISKDERLKAIKKLNEISPEYLGNLNLENINTDAARISVEKYTRALLENAKQKAIAEKVSELYGKQMDAEIRYNEAKAKLDKAQGSGDTASFGSDLKKGYREWKIRKELEGIEHEITLYTKLNQQLLENKNIKSKDLDPNSYTAIEYRYIKAQEELEKLESKHAKVYNKVNKKTSGVLKPDDSEGFDFSEQTALADQKQLKLLSAKLAKQREITAARKKELEAAKKVSGDNEDKKNTPTSTPSQDKSAYKEKIAALEAYIEKEKNILRQKHLDGKITKKHYQFELEQLEIKALNEQLKLYISDDEKRQQIIGQIMDKQLSAREKMNDILLTSEKTRLDKEAELRRQADETREKQNFKTLKNIAKQNMDSYKEEFERQSKQKAEMVALSMNFADEMGTLISGAVTGNEDIVASSLKSLIGMALDFLKVQVQMAVAGATAQSLAQPDSVATFGMSGLARAAVLVGLIEAAFAVVKGVVNSAIGKIGKNSSSTASASSSVVPTGARVANSQLPAVSQAAEGRWDVVGADDGVTYRNVPYRGVARTGIVSAPTLMGERGDELIIDNPTLRNIRMNAPYVLDAVRRYRVRQRAAGSWEASTPDASGGDAAFGSVIRENTDVLKSVAMLLQWLRENRIEAYTVLSEFEKKRDLRDKSVKKGSLS